MWMLCYTGSTMKLWPFGSTSSEPTPTQPPDPNAGPTLRAPDEAFEKRYKREVWWLENHGTFGKLLVLLVIALEVTLGLIGLWAFADYYLLDYVEEQRLVQTFFEGNENLTQAVQAQVPQEVLVDDARVVVSQGAYDVIAMAENPNRGHVAQVTYRFVYGDRSSEQRQMVLLQESRVPLVSFGIEAPRPTNARVVIDKVEWWRIDAHTIPDPLAWKQARLNLQFTDLVHTNDVTIGERVISRTTAQLTNASGYGYYEVPVYVVLKRGGAVTGVNRTILTNLQAREQRAFQMDWFDGTATASSVEVYPVVNIFDSSAYLPSDAEAQTDVRDSVFDD